LESDHINFPERSGSCGRLSSTPSLGPEFQSCRASSSTLCTALPHLWRLDGHSLPEWTRRPLWYHPQPTLTGSGDPQTRMMTMITHGAIDSESFLVDWEGGTLEWHPYLRACSAEMLDRVSTTTMFHGWRLALYKFWFVQPELSHPVVRNKRLQGLLVIFHPYFPHSSPHLLAN
jgi:hypothetical protein